MRDVVLHKDRLDQVRRAFFVWICLHTGMGLIDLLGKLGGVGDVLAPIRTASYAMLTEAEQGGFARIAGAYSEASAFGGVSLSCLAFSYTYWRMTKDRLAQWLAITLLALVLLSTSSTAYVGLAILGLGVFFSIGRSVVQDRLETDDLLILALLSISALVVVAIGVYDGEGARSSHAPDQFSHPRQEQLGVPARSGPIGISKVSRTSWTRAGSASDLAARVRRAGRWRCSGGWGWLAR